MSTTHIASFMVQEHFFVHTLCLQTDSVFLFGVDPKATDPTTSPCRLLEYTADCQVYTLQDDQRSEFIGCFTVKANNCWAFISGIDGSEVPGSSLSEVEGLLKDEVAISKAWLNRRMGLLHQETP